MNIYSAVFLFSEKVFTGTQSSILDKYLHLSLASCYIFSREHIHSCLLTTVIVECSLVHFKAMNRDNTTVKKNEKNRDYKIQPFFNNM